MKRIFLYLFIILPAIFFSLIFIKPVYASYTNHTQNGSWNFNGRIDDFNYVYCDLALPVDNRVGSLTEVTLKVDCIDSNVGRYGEEWRLDIYRAGAWDGINGGIPQGIKTAEVIGVSSKQYGDYSGTTTLTISIPDGGYNGLGFRYIDLTDDREQANFDITVTRIKYRIYSVDGFEPVITWDRYALMSIIQNTPVSNMSYIITRSPRDESREQYGVNYTDMNVDPEKYYTYSLCYGFFMGRATGSVISKTIKIPSDASEAKESADEARDKANQTFQDTTYIRNSQLPAIQNKIVSLETTVNNINNNLASDNMAPIVKVQTTSGARATSSGSIPSIISVTDNSAGPFEYRVNGGAWSGLPPGGQVQLPVNQPGMNAIMVEVKDPFGNIGQDVIAIRKL